MCEHLHAAHFCLFKCEHVHAIVVFPCFPWCVKLPLPFAQADLRLADIRAKRRAMEDAYMALQVIV